MLGKNGRGISSRKTGRNIIENSVLEIKDWWFHGAAVHGTTSNMES